MAKLMNSWVNRLGSLLGGDSSDADAGPDLSRRMVLTGAVAAIACGGLLVAGISTPAAAAEVAVDEGVLAQHGRRRSRNNHNDHHDDHHDHDGHSRRRSRNQHSRHRSEDHGRRRSRREYRDWNENCFVSPLGWICF